MTFYLPAFLKGIGISFSLIIAIGMQNAFVLKQGIMRNNVLAIVLTCAFSDTALIVIGVNGLGELWNTNILLHNIANWGGILFLFGYGIKSFISAFKNNCLVVYNEVAKSTIKHSIAVALAVSFLNPHTFLDACVLMSGIASNFSEDLRFSFTFGAIFASFAWFFLLGFGAIHLRKYFEKPIAWKILDSIIGVIMFAIAISLLRSIL